ncbi:12913_t:CDS:2, partial [Dentiscutata heterogama]
SALNLERLTISKILKEKEQWLAITDTSITNYQLHEESNSTPLELLPKQRAKLHEIIRKYLLNDVFNADEMG